MRIRHRAVACAIFWRPLVRTSGALGQFPFEAEQVIEEIVTPLGRRLRPGDFQAAADGVSAKTFSKFILPPQALLVDFGAFGFRAHVVRWNGCAVSFAEGMAARNQCD